MTAPVGAEDASAPPPRPAPDAQPDANPAPRARAKPLAIDTVAAICPYLTSAGGSWRIATASRDHRCAAVEPPAAQPNDKQRRHCLTADHVECSTYRVAREARAATLAGGADPALVEAADGRRRPLARTAPILLEPPSLVDQAVRLRLDRGPGQIALVGLMIVAFAIVALTRLSAGGPAVSPAPLASTVAVTPSHTPSRPPTPTPSSESSSSASLGPGSSFSTTYKVVKGDTLITIAKRYGTTAAKIKALNGLKSSTLRIGQVLKIP